MEQRARLPLGASGDRYVRATSLVVTLALVAASCGSGSSSSSTPSTSAAEPSTSEPDAEDPTDTDEAATVAPTSPASTTPATPATPATVPQPPPPLLADGLVAADALAAVLDADGLPDPTILAEYARELLALPVEEQIAAVADLALRTELEAASVSGLEAAIGDRAATEQALTAAWAQVQIQTDAAIAEIAAITEAGSTPSGFRSAAAAPDASGAGVAALGLFLGYMALSLFGKVATEGSNRMEPGQRTDTDPTAKGMRASATTEEVTATLEYTGDQDGVAVQFTATTTIHPCPGPDGAFDFQASIDVKANKGGVGQNARIDLDVTGHVGDDAEIVSKQIENHTQWADFGGGGNQFVDYTMSGPTGVEQFTGNRSGGKVTDEFVQGTAVLSILIALMIESQLTDAAETAWKSGRCVKLTATPSAGPEGLDPSQTVDVRAEPRSKVDGAPTGGTVTATLASGGAAVEPDGSALPADADFVYTAPDQPDEQGTVAFESKSKRGIGTAQITFSTAKPAAYQVVGGLQDWQVSQVVCDITVPFTLTSPGVGVADFSGGLSGTYSATGVYNFSYSGNYDITLEDGLGSPGTMVATSGGTIAGQAGSGSENYVLTPTTC
jgi:hypothetical protein